MILTRAPSPNAGHSGQELAPNQYVEACPYPNSRSIFWEHALSLKAGSGRPSFTLSVLTVLKELLGYGLCSAAALALDCGLLYGLTLAGMNYLPAAAIGFLSGMLLAYLLSVRFVYSDRRGVNRAWEAAGFFAIGIAGLAFNQILLFAYVDGLHASLIVAKGLTTLFVFLFNFIARRGLLFSVCA